MSNVLSFLNNIIWGVPMIIFLFGAHIYLTVKTGFIQKYVFKGLKLTFKKSKNEKGQLSLFSSLMTALSSTIGTGNIIGVGTAIVSGGPGAVLWTWIGGILGIATKYAESFIAVKHRRKKEDGSYIGGAFTALEDKGQHFLAKMFLVCCVLAGFGIGTSTQSNAIADVIKANWNISKSLIGIILVILTFIVIFGGVKSISKVCDKLVPIMAGVYVIGCVVILAMNFTYLPKAMGLIISSAFTPRAAIGGFIGSTIITASRFGIARGLFSNEAGMGSSPIATATSNCRNAVEPALVGATGVFWDTVVICLVSGLVIVSGILASNGAIDSTVLSGGGLVTAVFGEIPYIGKPLLVFGIITFAYSTILGWNYYCERCFNYLFPKITSMIYQAAWVIVVYLGAVMALDTVWAFADIVNGAMCIPNIIAVLLLIDEIVKDTKHYLWENHMHEYDEELQ